MDHQRAALHVRQGFQLRRLHRRLRRAVRGHFQARQVARMAFLLRLARAVVRLRVVRVEVAAGRAGRHLLAILLGGAAVGLGVHVEAARARRQAGQGWRERQAAGRFRDRHIAQRLTGAGRIDGVDRHRYLGRLRLRLRLRGNGEGREHESFLDRNLHLRAPKMNAAPLRLLKPCHPSTIAAHWIAPQAQREKPEVCGAAPGRAGPCPHEYRICEIRDCARSPPFGGDRALGVNPLDAPQASHRAPGRCDCCDTAAAPFRQWLAGRTASAPWT